MIDFRKLNLMTDKQKELIDTLNKNKVEYDNDKTLVELFVKQVIKTPNNIAIVTNTGSLTYKELHDRSNQVANLFRSIGVENGDIIPIMMEKCIEYYIGLLGVLKAGAVYLPLNEKLPKERIQYILDDCGGTVAISKSEYMNDLDNNKLKLVMMDELLGFQKAKKRSGRVYDQQDLKIMAEVDTNLEINSKELAYIFYTSGSTGLPKGVMVEHNSVVNLITWIKEEFSISQESKIMQNAALFFDASVQMIFSALTSGATLYPTPDDIKLIPSSFTEWILDKEITHWDTVPSLWYSVVEYIKGMDGEFHFPQLEAIMLAGEPLYVDKVNTWRQNVVNNHDIFNIYGPTEATVNSTFYKVRGNEEGNTIPIGKPFQNMEVYILSNNLVPCLPNVVGEIYIGGAGVARGYLNNPKLSSENFIVNPLPNNKGRLYKSGDFAKLLPTGEIEYVGRKDEQIKINGQRIEIFEIETAMRGCIGVKDASVIYKRNEENNKGFLVGYYIPENKEKEYSFELLKDNLKEKLPKFMIPTKFQKVEEFPLTSNKKIDKKALESILDQDSESVPPNTNTEKKIASIWKEVLGVNQISKTDDFFNLGGDSITSILVRHKCEQNGISIKNVDLFKYSRLDVLSSYVDSNKNKANKLNEINMSVTDHLINLNEKQLELLPKNVEAVLPVLPMQKAMLFVDKTNKANDTPYIIQSKFEFKGKVNKKAFEKAFNVITHRHQALRTIFKLDILDEPLQIIQKESTTKVKWHYLDGYSKNEQIIYIRNLTDKARKEGINLQDESPLCVDVFVKDGEHYDVLWTIHHIIVDGWSSSIVLEEFMLSYNGYISESFKPLPVLEINYKDYINTRLSMEEKTAKHFWGNYLKDVTTTVLPKEINTKRNVQFGKINTKIPVEVVSEFKNIAQNMKCTLNNVCLAAYSVLLSHITNQLDVTFGLVTSGRDIPLKGIEKTVGCLINTIPLKVNLNKEISGNKIIEDIKDHLYIINDNKNLDFSEIRKLLPHLGDKELIESIFLFQNYPGVQERTKFLDGQSILLNNEETEDTHYPFTVVCNEDVNTGEVKVTFKYSKQYFKGETVNKWAELFTSICTYFAEHINKPISEWNGLTKDDKYAWEEFNDTTHNFNAKTIVEKFEDAANTFGNLIAVNFEGEYITYKDLQKQTNQLGNLLHSSISGNEPVMVVCSKGINLYKSILGVLKAGGAYVPAEPDFPIKRILDMLHDSSANVIIAEKNWFMENSKSLPKELTYILIDYVEKNSDFEGYKILNEYNVSSQSADLPIVKFYPNDVIYYIYTSGSTGKPKGVKIPHESLNNFIDWYVNSFNINKESNVSQNASICFDASIQGVFSSLTTGSTLYPVPNDIRTDAEMFINWLYKNEITHLDAVPSHWGQLLNEVEQRENKTNLNNLKWIVLGGESLDYKQTYNWNQSVNMSGKIVHVYGPTETTINASWNIVDFYKRQGKVPIGVPLPNYQIHVLNPYELLCSPNIFGEIYISGKGLAKGYTSKLETQKLFKFINGKRYYKTGDVGRLIKTEEGKHVLEFSHRSDNQVKVNGYRLEMGEIENVVKSHPEVSSTSIIVRKQDNSKQILCFYTARSECSDQLKSYVNENLPLYMTPSNFIRLQQMPLTLSNKVDKRELERIFIEKYTKQDIIKSNDLTGYQRRLYNIWYEDLKLEVKSITDNFFEIGGSSLLAMNLLTKVKKLTKCHVNLQDIYAYPTIKKLSDEIEFRELPKKDLYFENDLKVNSEKNIEIFDRVTVKDLIKNLRSPFEIQRGDFYSKPNPLTTISLNIDEYLKSQTYLTLKFSSSINLHKLSNAIYNVISSHTLLHCNVDYDNQENPFFRKFKFKEWKLPYVDLNLYKKEEKAQIKEELEKYFYLGFKVTQGPLFRIVLVKENDEYQLYWWFSHLITDAESIRTISQHLKESYYEGQIVHDIDDNSYKNYVEEINNIKGDDINVSVEGIQNILPVIKSLNNFISTIKVVQPVYFEKSVEIPFDEELDISSGIKKIYRILTESVANWSNCTKVPFLELRHGRHMNGKSYFNVVGNFIDYKPVIGDSNLQDNKISNEAMLDSSINYGSLINELYLSTRNKEYAENIINTKYPLYFNFLDDKDLKDENIENIKHEEKYQEHLAGSIHFQIVRKKDFLLFSLIGYGISEFELQKLFNDIKNKFDQKGIQ